MGHYIAACGRRITAVIAACLVALGVAAGVPSGELEPGGVGDVVTVVDGDTLTLGDGRVLRLAGILAPKHGPLQDEPLADAARAALSQLALGHTIVIAFGGRHMDRHGRFLAQLWLAAPDGSPDGSPTGSLGPWLQEAMLAAGLARVDSMADVRARVPEMLRIEDAARRAGRGLWADPAYRLRTSEDVGTVLNSFQIVEGQVVDVATAQGRGYVNFGADYKTDFTLAFDAAALRLMRDAGRPLESLRGHRLRARGWVRWFNGPLIDVSHPEQIEVLD